MYEVLFAPQAERYIKKIKDKNLKMKFKDAVLAISENPYIAEEKRGDLSGFRSYDVRYNGVNYEMAYKIYETDGKRLLLYLQEQEKISIKNQNELQRSIKTDK